MPEASVRKGGRARLAAALHRRPVLTVAVFALAVRLMFAVASFVLNDGGLFPDERHFLNLANHVADGRGAESVSHGRGRVTYDQRWLFLAPLARLSAIFGPSRLPGQLLAAVAGTATAAFTALGARRFLAGVTGVRPSQANTGALAAGFVVAFLPSQVVWSSVVLVDALAWAALAAMGCGVILWGTGDTGRQRALAAFTLVGGLLSLGWLKPQTLVIAAWALMLTAAVAAWRQWRVMAFTAGIAAIVPLLAGHGLAGVSFLLEEAPAVGETRAFHSMDAGSAVIRPSTNAMVGDNSTVYTDRQGRRYVAPGGLAANLRYLPEGIAVATARPFPGESTTSSTARLASIENIGWGLLYVLGGAGLLWAPASARRLLAFPAAFTVLYVGSAALTQGNVGTAFRHRGQVVWALALFVAMATIRPWRRSPEAPVAVVIPTRNRPVLLERAIRSALAQTLPPSEVVVVDDGSVPPVALVADLGRDTRVKVLRTEDSAGSGGARNFGVANSSAPLVAFLDDDDEWYPAKLEQQVAVMNSLPKEVAAVDCGYELCEPGRRSRRRIPDPERDLRRLLLERPSVLPSTLMVRREAFDAVGWFRTELARTEDWDFSIRLAEQFRMATVQEVLVRWNRSGTPPDVALGAYQTMVRRSLEPRIAKLGDRREQARLTAWHMLNEGAYLAQAGHRNEARAVLWRAWRTYPHSLGPLAQLLRTVVGERAWAAFRRAAHW